MFLCSFGHSTHRKCDLKVQQHCKYCPEQKQAFIFFMEVAMRLLSMKSLHVYRPTFDVSEILDWDFKDLVLLHALYMFTVVEMNNDLILVFNNIQSVLTSKGKMRHRF